MREARTVVVQWAIKAPVSSFVLTLFLHSTSPRIILYSLNGCKPPQLLSLNKDSSQCSMWLLEGRHRQRCISAVDRAKRGPPWLSMKNGPDDATNMEELASLYFCNGFRRPGSKCSIPDPVWECAVRLLSEQVNAGDGNNAQQLLTPGASGVQSLPTLPISLTDRSSSIQSPQSPQSLQPI